MKMMGLIHPLLIPPIVCLNWFVGSILRCHVNLCKRGNPTRLLREQLSRVLKGQRFTLVAALYSALLCKGLREESVVVAVEWNSRSTRAKRVRKFNSQFWFNKYSSRRTNKTNMGSHSSLYFTALQHVVIIAGRYCATQGKWTNSITAKTKAGGKVK